MKAGRKLDALIAEKVMGWTRNLDDKYGERPWKQPTGELIWADSLSAPAEYKMPHYSTDISAAWEVVEKLKSDSLAFTIHNFTSGVWVVRVDNNTAERNDFKCEATADTAPHAICLAALKALGLFSELT